MKAAETKASNPARANCLNPFFNRDGQAAFFSAEQESIQTKPFFIKPSTQPYIQTKLSFGQPGDKYEQEADAMADQVVQRLSQPETRQTKSTGKYTSGILAIQAKCAACEQEEQLQKKGENDPQEGNIQRKGYEEVHQSAPPSHESSVPFIHGSDRPLPQGTRQQMESSFGADFGKVRIHTGSNAVQMNKDLNAQAFTHGHDIYFNAGKYNPDSSNGKYLLAHELTHTLQQTAKPPIVQRVEDDKHDLTSPGLSGDPVLEQCFDNERVVGMFSNSRGEHVKKIQEALLQLGIPLPEFGADEKFGNETANAVKEFQQKANMSPMELDGVVGKKTIGLLDRSLRNNKIEPDTDVAKGDFTVFDPERHKKDEACKGKPTEQTCSDPTNTVVNASADQAIPMIDKVLKEQLPPVKNKKADYPLIFNKIFRKNDPRDLSITVDEVRDIFIQIKNYIIRLKADKDLVRCATACDGGCRSGAPAYHTRLKSGKHIITFCPDFEKDPDRILILIHESHHAAIPGSSDIAYATTRLFDQLDHKKALLNAASFHVYAAWVDQPGSQPIGPAIKDTNLINDGTKKHKVNKSLAFMEQWFRLVPFDTSETVQGTQEAREKGRYTQHNAEVFMELVFSKWFGLTSPPAIPTEIDVQKLKAIDERTNTMSHAFGNPLVILETANQSFWERGPGSGIALNDAVLQLDIDRMIIALLQELVHATPNISAESEPLYVGTINDMRNLRDLDP